MKNNYISQLHFISKHLVTILVLGLLVFGTGSALGLNYYSKNNTAPHALTSWTANADGTGANPTNFTSNNSTFIIQATHTMTTTATWTVGGTGSSVQVNGTLVAVNAVTAPSWIFNSGSTYEHKQNGGTIPTSTWNSGSLLKITGITSTGVSIPKNIGGDIEWNCSAQTADVDVYADISNTVETFTVGGNFTISNTNTKTISMFGFTGKTLNIGGNLSISNGNVLIEQGTGDTDTQIINIIGNLTLNSGTISGCTTNDNITNISLKGNWTQSGGTITESGNNSVVNIAFSGTTTQTYTKTSGTISNSINFAVNSGSTLDVGTSVINGGGTFTLNSGASIITAHTEGLSTSGATGSIQVGGLRTYASGANYTYNGTTAQATGNGLTQNTPANLTINSTNTVTLSAATTLSRNLLISNGTLNCAQYQITGNATGTMTMAAGTGLGIGRNGQWDTNIFPTSFTKANINLNPTSTVTYYGNSKVLSSVPNYGNLTASLTNGQYLDPDGNTTINGNLTINSGNVLRAYNVLSTMTIGGQLINNGTLSFLASGAVQTATVSGNLSGSGAININNGTHILNLYGQNNTIGTFTTDGNNSVVNYVSAGNQQVFASPNYRSLSISGGGTKTFAGTININNRFTINDNAKANLGNLTHTANEYYLGAALQYKGRPGSSSSTATYTNDTNFDVAAPGILNTTTGACGPGYWTGATNTDWNTASNWCDNKVPTASTNVYVPNVTNKPIIGTAGGLCNNITIQSGSSLTQGDATVGASNLFVYGNWTNNGSYTSGVGTTTFAGASAQTIGGTNNTSFYNLTIQNTGGVTLSRPTTVTRAILLISGNVNTSSTNSLTVTNPANSGIMGGSSGSYINGPVTWIIQANLGSGSSYNFPIGNNTYLPYTLVNPITGGTAPVVQVQAFSANSGGTVSSPLTTISNTEYWKLTTTGNLTSTQISLGKGNNQIYPYNAILQGATVNGAYSSLNGTVGFYDITNSNATPNINNFFTLGTNNTPTINILPTVLGGFGYIFNFGPSSEQSFSVNGTSLPASIVVSAPTDFEISQTTNVGFAQTITLATDASGKVNNVKLYVRLKADLPVGTYNNEQLSVTSNTTTKTIILNGTVYPTTPSIITSGGKSCTGDSIVLSSSGPNIDILYWTGPNNFYSQDANPKITPTTASMYGTYTVTGSIPTGTNLILNGDFEAGNTGFLSSYSYTTGANSNQGVYTVTDNANSLNGAFSPITPGNKQMVIDGATIANVTVWSQTVSVIPNSTYQFTYYLRREVDANPSIIQLYANNQALGTPFTASSAVGLYKKYYYNWFSGSSTSVTLDLRNQNTIANGNDFSLDNIDFKTVSQVSSSVIVTGDSRADVAISTPTTNVASGTNVTFTASPTNGGTAPLYQWYVNNVAVGTNSPSSTFNYVPNNNDAIKVVMTSNRTCATTNNPATSTIIIMTVTGIRNYWIGASGPGGTVWSDPANWTAVKVPATGDNVEFATGGSTGNNGLNGRAKNDLYVDYNRIVGNLINNASGKNLIIPADKELVVNNKISLTPVDINAPYDQIQIKCDPVTNNGLPNGSLIFHNNTNEPVNATVEMYTRALKTAPVLDPLTNKYYSYQWQSLGIPIRSVQADPTFYGSYVRKYDESINVLYGKWNQLSNGSTLLPFLGYEITQEFPKVVTFTGQLVNETKTLPLTYTSGVYAAGQNILSNPYTAAIDIRKMTFDVANTEETIFLYNTGSFADWSSNNGGSTNTTANNPGQYTAIPKNTAGVGMPYDIPSMSGFLIKVTAATNITIDYNSIITKNESAKLVKNVDNVSSTDLVSTKIDLIGQNFSDRMWIFTEPTCTPNFDNGWDGRKMLGSSLAPQIYAIEPDGDYQVNSVSDMNNTDIAIQPGNEVEYTLKFTHENLQRNYAGVFLVDLIENKTIDITESGTTYKFATAPATTPSKRFKIITRYYEKDAPDTESLVKIFSAKSSVFIQNLGTSNGNCTLYNITGQAVKSLSFGPGSITSVPNLRQGTYVVSATTNGEKVSKRVIVQ